MDKAAEVLQNALANLQTATDYFQQEQAKAEQKLLEEELLVYERGHPFWREQARLGGLLHDGDIRGILQAGDLLNAAAFVPPLHRVVNAPPYPAESQGISSSSSSQWVGDSSLAFGNAACARTVRDDSPCYAPLRPCAKDEDAEAKLHDRTETADNVPSAVGKRYRHKIMPATPADASETAPHVDMSKSLAWCFKPPKSKRKSKHSSAAENIASTRGSTHSRASGSNSCSGIRSESASVDHAPPGLDTQSSGSGCRSLPAEALPVGLLEPPKDVLKINFKLLQSRHPDCILIARKINRLGFDSATILQNHFEQFGVVETVLVAHSHAKRQTRGNSGGKVRHRPAGLGFIVMTRADDAAAILTYGDQHIVEGVEVFLSAFREHSALATEFPEVSEEAV